MTKRPPKSTPIKDSELTSALLDTAGYLSLIRKVRQIELETLRTVCTRDAIHDSLVADALLGIKEALGE